MSYPRNKKSGADGENLFVPQHPGKNLKDDISYTEPNLPPTAPLAARLAPVSFEDFAGQEHILGAGKFLRRAIESGRLGSAIFFGPPGTGKTACARLAARLSRARFVEINAVTAGVSDIRNIIQEARFYLSQTTTHQPTTLVVDEIHHFNRSQQDALLPDVERGNITLIGLTTENPYFYINSALVSRANVFEFKALSTGDLRKILDNAVRFYNEDVKGFGKKVKVLPDAAEHLVIYSSGDARRLLNALELAVDTTPPSGKDGDIIVIDLSAASEAIQKRPILYDKSSDSHYDHISAFIKSMRGSDPDAAVYWMAKMLEAGEDPRFIARRVIIQAAEDVGMADPQALVVAAAALDAVEFVGMPEASIPLTEAVVYVSTAPKSNASYLALERARKEVAEGEKREVPIHLKDASLDSASLGHGKGYKYPHDFPHGFVKQVYMPEHKIFYEPKDIGFEREIKKRLLFFRRQHEEEDVKGDALLLKGNDVSSYATGKNNNNNNNEKDKRFSQNPSKKKSGPDNK